MIRQNLSSDDLDPSFVDIIFRLAEPKDIYTTKLEDLNENKITTSSGHEIPIFLQVKQRQMEQRRDWSGWLRFPVCGFGL